MLVKACVAPKHTLSTKRIWEMWLQHAGQWEVLWGCCKCNANAMTGCQCC